MVPPSILATEMLKNPKGSPTYAVPGLFYLLSHSGSLYIIDFILFALNLAGPVLSEKNRKNPKENLLLSIILC